jgi:hypothetical protein
LLVRSETAEGILPLSRLAGSSGKSNAAHGYFCNEF